jgi:hypothetical protein
MRFQSAQDLFPTLQILASLPENQLAALRSADSSNELHCVPQILRIRASRANMFSGGRFSAVAWCPEKSPNRTM